jgi:hypothetical protein
LSYEIGMLLDHLAEHGVDEQRIARFEWGFFSVLEYHREPRFLFRALAEHPDLFVDLVCLAFKAKGDSASEIDEQSAALARHAYGVLSSWRSVPGLSDGHRIDSHHLRRWVRQARSKRAERDRAEIGDDQIGHLLSGSPVGDDGYWPAEVVRELLEDLASPVIDEAVEIGRLNARGITSRSPYEGGTQERVLSGGYRRSAEALSDEWPRTARILKGLADFYDRDARREDAEADREAADA